MYRTMMALSLLIAGPLHADTTATTKDGQQVILKDNGTWLYAKDAKYTMDTASLRLEMRRDIPNGCKLGLRLSNQLDAQIRTLVLRFTAYKGGEAGDVPYETVSRGYSFIKPTNNQYQEIRFRGLGCGEIGKVQVSAAHNCHVGELTKYSADEGRCSELVRVEENNLLTLYKAPNGAPRN